MREFTVGGVLRRAGALFRDHAGLLGGLAALFVALPHAAALGALRFAPPRLQGLSAGVVVIYWLGSLLLQAAAVGMTADEANRRPSRFGDLVGVAARSFFPVLLISILFGVAVTLASFLLVFPGQMLFCRWFVVIPVRVAERQGVAASFGRSAQLTDGVRWRVFGILLLLSVLNVLITLGFAFLGGLAGRLVPGGWPLLAGTVVGTALAMLFASLAYAAAYAELREIREGAISEELISVFN